MDRPNVLPESRRAASDVGPSASANISDVDVGGQIADSVAAMAADDEAHGRPEQRPPPPPPGPPPSWMYMNEEEAYRDM
eukprot:3979235-Karenia_brevis.AAC.1